MSRFARSSVVASDRSRRQRVRGNGPSTVQATRASNINKRIVKLIRRVVLWYVLPSEARGEKREYIEISYVRMNRSNGNRERKRIARVKFQN